MALDFPSTPNVGDTYPGPSSSWVWDGRAWNVVPIEAGGGGASVYAGDTPPPVPDPNQLWFKTSTGVLYIYYTDADSSQWVQVSASPQMVDQNYARKTARGPNRFANPCMEISQENGQGMVATDLGYPADGACARLSGISAQFIKTGNAQSPDGTGSYVYMFATTAKPSLAATDLMGLAFPIEANDLDDFTFGSTTAAKAAVLCFSVLGGKVGTYGFSFVLAPTSFSYCGTFTIDAAWTPKKIIVPIPALKIPQAGFNPSNALGAVLYVMGACGSNNIGVAGWQNTVKLSPPGCLNLAETTGQQLYVTDVALYVDPENTGLPPPFEAPNYADTLAKCQRYWESGGANHNAYGSGPSATPGITQMFAATKRATPTMSIVGVPAYANASGAALAARSNYGVQIQATTTAAGMMAFDVVWAANARML